jgi:diguanylate cyclase (GGDEF)-like protein
MQELARTRRHNTFGSVMLLIDLDKFKEINDTHGHQAGDACLKKVAECLMKNIRNVDAAARIGGDEFAVLLSHTDPEKAANCVHQIRRALGSLQTVWQGVTLHIGASIGLKHVSDTSSFETAYLAADKALYNDKRGRKDAAGEIV